MKIVIHRGELSPYEEATNLSIDYMHNSVMGWYKGEEYQVYNFNHIGRLDNRRHSYTIMEENDIITIEFTK